MPDQDLRNRVRLLGYTGVLTETRIINQDFVENSEVTEPLPERFVSELNGLEEFGFESYSAIFAWH